MQRQQKRRRKTTRRKTCPFVLVSNGYEICFLIMQPVPGPTTKIYWHLYLHLFYVQLLKLSLRALKKRAFFPIKSISRWKFDGKIWIQPLKRSCEGISCYIPPWNGWFWRKLFVISKMSYWHKHMHTLHKTRDLSDKALSFLSSPLSPSLQLATSCHC